MRLVYLSPVPWASFTQRSHRFVEWFHARHGADVLWVDPYAARFPAWRDWRRVAGTRQRGTRDLAPRPAWLSVVKPCALPIEPLRALGPLHAHLWRRDTAGGRRLRSGRGLSHRHREAVGTGVCAYCNGFRMPSRCWMRWTTFRRSTARRAAGRWSTARAWWRRASPAFWYPPRRCGAGSGSIAPSYGSCATPATSRICRTPGYGPPPRGGRYSATSGPSAPGSTGDWSRPWRRARLRYGSGSSVPPSPDRRGRCRATWNCCPPASITRRCGPCRGSPSG